MAGIYRHPAPGLAELLPGWYAVPQNPITMARQGVTYTPGIGEILPGAFAVPQNPIKDYATGNVKLIGQQSGGAVGKVNGTPVNGMGDCGCGCGGGGGGGCGGDGYGGGGGMGDIAADFNNFASELTSGNIMGAVQAPIFGLPVWGWLGAAVLFMTVGGKESHVNRVRRAARAY